MPYITPSSFVRAADLGSTRYITHTCMIVYVTWDSETNYIVPISDHSANRDKKA